MLAARDARILELESRVASGPDSIVAELEEQVKNLEEELMRQRDSSPVGLTDEDSVPVAAVKKQKMQRAGAPQPEPAQSGISGQVEAELREALSEQQAEFEQLLAKQAEEMSAQFEEALMLSRAESGGSLEELQQLKADLNEKTGTCESLKRLIQQQDEVVAEQKKVLEAQASSASFAVENLQKMLREAQQKLKDDVERFHSKDAEIQALHETLKSKTEVEEEASHLQRVNNELTKQVSQLRSTLETRITECAAIKKQLQGLAMEKEAERKKSAEEMKRVQAEMRRDIDASKVKNQQLMQDAEMTMKRSWEQQDQAQRLTRQVEELKHALDIKEKTVSKLAFQLKQQQQNLNDKHTKMDRMENVIMIQESKLQEGQTLADNLRDKIKTLEESVKDGIHETELGAFEELAAVKQRLHVLEGEYEAMKGMVDKRTSYTPLSPDKIDSPHKIEKQPARMQRSAPPPLQGQGGKSPGPDTSGDMQNSTKLQLAQLEIDLQKQKDRADAAEHELTQLKVDVMMYEERYEDDWKEQLAKKKHDLMQESLDLRNRGREAESLIDALRVRWNEERFGDSEGKCMIVPTLMMFTCAAAVGSRKGQGKPGPMCKQERRKTSLRDVHDKCDSRCIPDSQCIPEQAQDEMSAARVKMNVMSESMEAGKGTDASSKKLMEFQIEEANGR